jgi:hypothetical protein
VELPDSFDTRDDEPAGADAPAFLFAGIMSPD